MNIDTTHGIDEFARLAVAQANRMGQMDAQAMIDSSNEKNLTKEKLAARLTARILEGADDRWSGRTNDLKRAYYEGFVHVAKRIVENVYIYA